MLLATKYHRQSPFSKFQLPLVDDQLQLSSSATLITASSSKFISQSRSPCQRPPVHVLLFKQPSITDEAPFPTLVPLCRWPPVHVLLATKYHRRSPLSKSQLPLVDDQLQLSSSATSITPHRSSFPSLISLCRRPPIPRLLATKYHQTKLLFQTSPPPCDDRLQLSSFATRITHHRSSFPSLVSL